MENESEKELTVAESIDTEEETVEESMEFTDFSEENQQDNDSSENNIEEDFDESFDDREPKQTKEERAMYNKVRRTIEKSVDKKHKEALDRAYERGRLEAYKGKLNPYTGTEIKDMTDVEVFEDMEKIAASNGDPLKDYASYAADKKRETERLAQEEEEKMAKARAEVDAFSKKYPDVNLSDLLKDDVFKDYAEGKDKSLIDVYESFNKLKTSFRNKGIETAKQTIANNISSPGSLSGGSDNFIDYDNMSREDFLKEVEKVKEK